MDGASELTEGRLQEIVEYCLRLALPEGAPLPAAGEDWITVGALDSMGHVDVLLCIEKAVGLKDFFSRAEGLPPTTTRAIVDAVQEALAKRREVAQEPATGTREGVAGAAEMAGWGFALGGRLVQTAEVEQQFALPAGTISSRAGITSVVRVSEEESEVTLAIRASQAALNRAAVDAGNVDWIVASSETFLGFPSLGSTLHSRLLARAACGVLDVGGACVGLLNGLFVARSLLAAGMASQILVATADVHSRRLAPGQVAGEFGGLFGDGASAFLLSRAEDAAASQHYRLGDFQFGCAGTFSSALVIGAGAKGEVSLQFDGEALARAAVARLERIIKEIALHTGLGLEAASSFATHQPNPRLLELLARQAGLPLEKFPVVAKTCGNLGSSTCGVALAKALEEHGIKPADQRGPIFLAAVGPGMLWGGGVLY